ncbi:MAG: hypothetical protein ACT4O1_11830 [Gemmatimonadota bacterium]
MKRFRIIAPIILLVCACARQTTAQQPTPVSQTSEDSTRKALVQAGFGTLKQDEFTIGIRSGNLLVKVTPLNEQIIRLAAPDTYKRLNALAESRRADAVARSNSRQPELFLVSFFSYQPDQEFNPEDVQLDYSGQLLRPAAILPLNASWGKQRMGQQETQAAVYAFGEPLDFELPLVLKYGMEENREWQRIIPKLQVERNKILSRQQSKE